MTEYCMRTGKALLNPIIDWEESDVWEFLNNNGIEHCCLYDRGYKRIGCIGCPLSNGRIMAEELERYPAYKKMYLSAFKRMIAERKKRGMTIGELWSTPESVMKWWLGEKI